MPYTKSGNINIYYEVEGEGPPLVLAHGGSSYHGNWRNFGYTDVLKNDYQLILFDFRGHGKSDKPHEEADYGINMKNDVVAVLDDMKISKAHYYGYSLGALIGFWLAIKNPDRFSSFILTAMGPYGYPEPMVNLNRMVIRICDLLVTDSDKAIQEMEKFRGGKLATQEREEFLARDGKAGGAMTRAQLDIPPLSNDELATISQPCLICCGDLDPFYTSAKESAEYISKAEFVTLPGLDHGSTRSRNDMVLPHVKEFLAGVENKGA